MNGMEDLRNRLAKLAASGTVGEPASVTVKGTTYQYFGTHGPCDQHDVKTEEHEAWAIRHFLAHFDNWLAGRSPDGIVWRRHPQLECKTGQYKVTARACWEPPANAPETDFVQSFEPGEYAKRTGKPEELPLIPTRRQVEISPTRRPELDEKFEPELPLAKEPAPNA